MRFLQKLIGMSLRPAAERRARGRSFEDLAADLEAAWPAIARHLEDKPDSAANREALAHCAGIERWGQSQLRVAFGDPLEMDTYHAYRPPVEQGVAKLTEVMARTRRDTVALAHALAEDGIDPKVTVRHNDLGDLSLGGWLVYLRQHASRELPLRARR